MEANGLPQIHTFLGRKKLRFKEVLLSPYTFLTITISCNRS